MKKFLLFAFASVFLGTGVFAQELPVASPRCTMTQRVGLTDISLSYSRPGVKDREIFGKLVPFGEVWRTGANECTTISFSTAVNFGGKEIQPGKYALFTIPKDKMNWIFILNSNADQWGAFSYDASLNVAEVPAKGEMVNDKTESMLIYLDNIRDNAATLVLKWDQLKVSVPLTFDVKALAEKNIKTKLDEIKNTDKIYSKISQFYAGSGKDPKQAISFANMAIQQKSSARNYYSLSLAYASAHDFKEAIQAAQTSLEMATKEKNDEYIKFNKQNIEKWKNESKSK